MHITRLRIASRQAIHNFETRVRCYNTAADDSRDLHILILKTDLTCSYSFFFMWYASWYNVLSNRLT